MSTHVQKPGWFTVDVLNRAAASLTRRGLSVWGSRVLAIHGRKSGQWRRTPVNLLTVDGRMYLVAPCGHVQWTHNMRATGGGELHLGKKAEAFTATEVPDNEKPELLRAYLKRRKAEVGLFFGPQPTIYGLPSALSARWTTGRVRTISASVVEPRVIPANIFQAGLNPVMAACSSPGRRSNSASIRRPTPISRPSPALMAKA